MIKTEFIENDELPYRIIMDKRFHGAGINPKDAVMALLRVGNFIPKDCKNYNRAKSHLFWYYEINNGWNFLIQVLGDGEYNWIEEADK